MHHRSLFIPLSIPRESRWTEWFRSYGTWSLLLAGAKNKPPLLLALTLRPAIAVFCVAVFCEPSLSREEFRLNSSCCEVVVGGYT